MRPRLQMARAPCLHETSTRALSMQVNVRAWAWLRAQMFGFGGKGEVLSNQPPCAFIRQLEKRLKHVTRELLLFHILN
jgi:hypothetical protein